MAGATVFSDWDANFKERYADRLSQALPAYALLQDLIPFKTSKRTGSDFHQAVQLRLPASVTYMASGDGLVTLHDVIASKIEDANVKGSQIVCRDALDYEALFSGQDKEQAFSPTLDTIVEGLWELGRFRLETDLLYGQDELGVVDGTPAANVVTLNQSEFGPGIWTLSEGAEIEVFDTLGTTKRTGIGANGQYLINSVDIDNRTITVDDDQNIADTDRIFFRGQRTTSAFKTMAGLHALLTGSGTLLGIDSDSFTLWDSPTVSAGNGPLLLDHVLLGCAKVSVKGQYGEMCALVNPTAFANSIADSAALRRYNQNSNIKKYLVGAEEIEFFTGTGKVTIKSHPLVKEGFAYVIPVGMYPRGSQYKGDFSREHYSEWYRVGATDLTFENLLEKARKGQSVYFQALPDSPAIELRTYSHQALFSGKLARSFAITDIVNDT